MLINTENFQGFTIKFYAEPEYMQYDGENEDGSPDLETINKIDSGELEWFCAKVTASKNGIELASEYLGGCCYNSYMDFVTQNDYYADMRAEAIEQAKQVILELTKE